MAAVPGVVIAPLEPNKQFLNLSLKVLFLDLQFAVQRQTGLAMMLGGNGILASVMGPDEDMAEPMMEPVRLTVCENCATESTSVAVLGLEYTEDKIKEFRASPGEKKE